MSIVCKDLSFSYNKKSYLLRNMLFELHKNEILCINGGTGSGKTTLFDILFGELKNYKGNITIDTRSLEKGKNLKNKISYLFQEPEKQFVFPSLKDEIDFILDTNRDTSISQTIKEICEIFNVKIEKYSDRNIYELSAGELRIFQIAFCLSAQTEYLVLDEPTEFLEREFRDRFINHIKTINNQGILILTKYPELYQTICHKSMKINKPDA